MCGFGWRFGCELKDLRFCMKRDDVESAGVNNLLKWTADRFLYSKLCIGDLKTMVRWRYPGLDFV